MKNIRLLLIPITLLMSGCAGGLKTGEFKPITSNGEECLAKCDAEKQKCLPAQVKNAAESDLKAMEIKCADSYSECLKPCREFDDSIKKVF